MIRALRDGGVDFIVIGGVAMAARGSAYVTNDLDIAYSRTRENIARLVAAIEPLHPRLRVEEPSGNIPFIFDARSIANGMNFTLVTDAGNVDLLGRIAGFDGYLEMMRASEPLDLYDGAVNVLTIDGLIRSKKAADRAKDRLSLPELEALREADSGSK